jgi:hypothetical protein
MLGWIDETLTCMAGESSVSCCLMFFRITLLRIKKSAIKTKQIARKTLRMIFMVLLPFTDPFYN